MEFEIIYFLMVMVGAAAMLIVVALLVSARRRKHRSMLTNPHKDHLYHYSRPKITDVPADYYTHRRRSESEAR